jgi:phospholipid/cholesterol/gamma-HCH transport system substrate-binding protein
VTRRTLAMAVVLATVALVTGWLLRERLRRDQGLRLHAYLSDARGIVEGGQVLCAGLRVGRVVGRSLEQSRRRARLDLQVWGVTLHEDAVVTKERSSLLGEYYLTLDPGTAGRRRLVDGDEVARVVEPLDVDAQTGQMGAVLPQLQQLLRDVRTLSAGPLPRTAREVNETIEANGAALDRLLRRVDEAAATVEATAERRKAEVTATVREVRALTARVREVVGQGGGRIDEAGREIASRLQAVRARVAEIEEVANQAEEMTGSVARGEGLAGTLVADPSLHDRILDATDGARELLAPITRMQVIVGLGTDYTLPGKAGRGYLQLYLVPRPRKFYLVELVQDRTRATDRRLETRADTRGGNSSDLVITTEARGTRVSVQIGQCLEWVCGRAGLKESTLGVGLDAHLFDGRLMLSGDLFDARSALYPRLRTRALLAAYKRYLWLTAGLDDAINEPPLRGGRPPDWFFGAQLRFDDRDLKNLLLVAGR